MRRVMAAAPVASSSSRVPPLAVAGPVARVRWDRVGRVAMLSLLVALLYLYVSAGVRIYSTYRQARSDRSQLAALEHEHVRLMHQHEALARRGTVEDEARRLGMMHSGEQPYVVTGLPGN
jgi:cell division protein FtsL